MNKERRERIAAVYNALDTLMSEIDEIHGEEQDYHDNMPESLQLSEKGEAAEAAAQALEAASDAIQGAMDELDSAQG